MRTIIYLIKYFYNLSHIVFSDKYLLVFKDDLTMTYTNTRIRKRHVLNKKLCFSYNLFNLYLSEPSSCVCILAENIKRGLQSFIHISCFSYSGYGSYHKSHSELYSYPRQVIRMICHDMLKDMYKAEIFVIRLDKLKDWKYHA